MEIITSTDLVAGVDEVGRGPLIGPVVAAAVILDPKQPIVGLTDSKKLSEKKREAFYQEITEKALAYCIAQASVAEIDELNILHASMLAMQRAVSGLRVQPHKAFIDGNRCPELTCSAEAVIGGDLLVPEISAASIIAKVHRDRHMLEMDNQYPGYDLAANKGYPTKTHLAALQKLGVTPAHRRSFGPVRRLLETT